MKARVIIYERLNSFTLCLCLINRLIFNEQYFIDFSPFLKKYCFKIVKTLKLNQISGHDFLGKGLRPHLSKVIIENTDTIIKNNKKLVLPMIDYGLNEKYIHVVKQLLINSLRDRIHVFQYIKLFMDTEKGKLARKVYVFPVRLNSVLFLSEFKIPKVSLIKVHYPCVLLVNGIYRIFYCLMFMVFPFYQIIMWLMNKQIAIRSTPTKVINKKIMFEHRSADLKTSSDASRDMYLFRRNIVNISDCIHVTSFGKFAEGKSSYLIKKGGIVTDYHDCKINLRYILNRLFFDYYKVVIMRVIHVCFNKYIDFVFVKGYIGVFYSILNFENVIKRFNIKLIYFEVEDLTKYSVYTVIANERGIKTMSMLHGLGPVLYNDSNRANMMFNYFLVSGRSYKYYLEKNNPAIEKFCLIGNHEIEDEANGRIEVDIKKMFGNIRHNNLVIGVLASFYFPFLPVRTTSNYNPLFFDDIYETFKGYWEPFFKWAGGKDNLFFIFKGKSGIKQYDHPYLKSMLEYIPKEKYIQDDSLDLNAVIDLLDVAVCTGNSSAIFACLGKGKPCVSLDVLQNGYNFKRYSEYLVADNGEELVCKLEYIMKNGLSESVFNDFVADNSPSAENINNKPSACIKKTIEDILSD